MSHVAKRRRTSLGRRFLGWWPIWTGWVALVGVGGLVYRVITRRGVQTTGDEPHYLVVAKALTELTIHPLKAYQSDLRTHRIFDWPAGAQATNLNLQLYTGPHGPVPTHSLGLSLLLAPFMFFGGDRLPRLGLMAIEAAGIIYFFVRAANAARLSRTARLIFALTLACPALWLAATQIYPDFLTGVLMAGAIVDLVILETSGDLGGWPTAVSGACLVVLPWLHQQNLVPAAILLMAFLVIGIRARRYRMVVYLTLASAGSWLILVAYNLYAYGHALGLPQPFPSLNPAGVTEILGLLFDRHQGLFVQVPTAVLGLLGLWSARRAAPRAAIATLLAAASLLYLNGTFVHAPYGGTSFAGRFEWSSAFPVLVWIPFELLALTRTRRWSWAVGAVVTILWVVQSIPILRGQHVYYNQFTTAAPWDPSTYPGWWMGLDRLLPEMDPGGRLFGWPWFGLPIAVGVTLVVTALIATWPAVGRVGATRLAATSAVATVAVAVLAATAPLPLPSGPLTYTDADFGGPLRTGAAPERPPPVPLTGIGRGTYRLAVDYQMSGPSGSSAISVFCGGGRPITSVTSASSQHLNTEPGGHHALLNLSCPTGTIWFQMDAGPFSDLAVTYVSLTKTSSG
jgi:hypothetical protein